jgi:HEAT repeat protein
MSGGGWRGLALAAVLAAAAAAVGAAHPAQERSAPSAAEIQTAISNLGSFEFVTRRDAARLLRRAPAEAVVPALAEAARSHRDQYAQYRAQVLLSGFGGTTAAAVMKDVLGHRNDRVRAVAYAWFGYHPDPSVLPTLIAALQTEQSEFVRPALTRAIAAHDADPRARTALLPLVTRGEDFFRGAVIEALGDHRGQYALDEIVGVAQLDGPLQDDAVTAIGRLGDKSRVPVLAALQKSAPREIQPTIAAALCLLVLKCDETDEYLEKVLAFGSAAEVNQPFVRGAAHALGLLATAGRERSLKTLFDAGVEAREPVQSPLALAAGLVAIRNPELVMRVLEARADRARAVELLRDAFDMLSEDFEEERFFVAVRKGYWAAPEGSPRREVASLLIEMLEF